MTTVTDDFAGLSPAEDITNDGNWVYVVGSDGSLRGTSTGGALEVGVTGVRVSALLASLGASSVYAQAQLTRLASGAYGSLGITIRAESLQNTFYYLHPDSFNGVYYLAESLNNVDQWSVTIPIIPAVGHIFKIQVTSGDVVQAFIDQGSGFPGTPDGSHDDSASPRTGFSSGVEGFQSAPNNSWWSTAWWPSPWWGSAWWPNYTVIAPAIDNFETGDIATGAAATGNLASAHATVSGTGIRTITSTGALASTAATIAGFQGTSVVTSTGALASPAATMDGSGYKGEAANRWFNNAWWPEPWWSPVWWNSATVDAIGDLASGVATIAGAGVRTGDSTGVLNSAAATMAGVAKRTIVSTGALASDASVIDGFGIREITSAGALASAAATITGLAQSSGSTVAIGALISAASSISGTALREVVSTGALASDSATIAGHSLHIFDATGNLASSAATVNGTAESTNNLIIGALISNEATIQGFAFREIVARGDIRSGSAFIDAVMDPHPHPTTRELLLRACFDAFESGEAFNEGVSVKVQIDLSKLTTQDLLWTALKHAGESTEDTK